MCYLVGTIILLDKNEYQMIYHVFTRSNSIYFNEERIAVGGCLCLSSGWSKRRQDKYLAATSVMMAVGLSMQLISMVHRIISRLESCYRETFPSSSSTQFKTIWKSDQQLAQAAATGEWKRVASEWTGSRNRKDKASLYTIDTII